MGQFHIIKPLQVVQKFLPHRFHIARAIQHFVAVARLLAVPRQKIARAGGALGVLGILHALQTGTPP